MTERQLDAEARLFVSEYFGGRASELSPLGAGEWSRAYFLILDGRESVIRFGQHVEDFLKDRAMVAIRSAALPIPQVTEVGKVAGDVFFAVSEPMRGEFLDDLDEAGMRKALPGLLVALDAVRQVDVSGSGGYGIWGPDGAGRFESWPEALLAVSQETERVSGWRGALENSSVGAAPFDYAYGQLRELVGDLPAERHIVHGDLMNRNVLVQGTDITAVLDWGNALYGDYLYDAAWLIYWWSWYPRWRAIDVRAELQQHWEQGDAMPDDTQHRLSTYLIHVGLGAMSYNAFAGRWEELARNAGHTTQLVRMVGR